MPAGSTVVADLLREAHVMELIAVRRLEFEVAVGVEGEDRTLLRDHLRQSRARVVQLVTRLEELDPVADRPPFRRGLHLTRSLVDQSLQFWRAPLGFLFAGSSQQKALQTARSGCAEEALGLATYTALQRVAEAVGDTMTAALARGLRKDADDRLHQHLARVPGLAEAVLRSQGRHEPTVDGASTEDPSEAVVLKVVAG